MNTLGKNDTWITESSSRRYQNPYSKTLRDLSGQRLHVHESGERHSQQTLNSTSKQELE
jgi:hypothetical protein